MMQVTVIICWENKNLRELHINRLSTKMSWNSGLLRGRWRQKHWCLNGEDIGIDIKDPIKERDCSPLQESSNGIIKGTRDNKGDSRCCHKKYIPRIVTARISNYSHLGLVSCNLWCIQSPKTLELRWVLLLTLCDSGVLTGTQNIAVSTKIKRRISQIVCWHMIWMDSIDGLTCTVDSFTLSW